MCNRSRQVLEHLNFNWLITSERWACTLLDLVLKVKVGRVCILFLDFDLWYSSLSVFFSMEELKHCWFTILCLSRAFNRTGWRDVTDPDFNDGPASICCTFFLLGMSELDTPIWFESCDGILFSYFHPSNYNSWYSTYYYYLPIS